MKTAGKKIPDPSSLSFRKGDLIIKQGDFGVSIYKIRRGTVRVYRESGDMEIPLATLGRGEIVGEMAFLNKGLEPRAASVRAAEDTEVEVWHPSMLLKEYERMTPILKYVADQALTRLAKMNELVCRYDTARGRSEEGEDDEAKGLTRRNQYRKKVTLQCIYRPSGIPKGKVQLYGVIKDISIGGIGMEISGANALNYSHDPGDEFFVEVALPNGKLLDFSAKVESARQSGKKGNILLGMAFTDIRDDARKTLGFFMMGG